MQFEPIIQKARHKKCKTCFYISPVQNGTDIICPNCKNSSKNKWDEYPITPALGFLSQAQANVLGSDEINHHLFHELQSACLFLCALYEVLLEGLITDFLQSIKTPEIVTELLLDAYQGQDRMSKLYSKLRENPLRDEMGDIYDKINHVIKCRNKYIHGTYNALDDIDKEYLVNIFENIIEAFVKVQNSFVTR